MVDPNELASDLPDEIVESVRAAREAHARAFGFDVARIVADLRAKDAASGEHLIRLPPKPARRRPFAVGQ
jgi:hypothetical protein